MQYRGYCVHYPLDILQIVSKSIYEKLTVYSMGCFFFSAPWYDLMNKKDFPSVTSTKLSLIFY